MKIFIVGAYFETDNNDTNVYVELANFFKSELENVIVYQPTDIENYRKKYVIENPDKTEDEVNKAMVDYDLGLIKSCDLILADISNKSTGLGIELGVAWENNKKVVLAAKSGRTVSNMVFGAFPSSEFIQYENAKQLSEVIKRLVKN